MKYFLSFLAAVMLSPTLIAQTALQPNNVDIPAVYQNISTNEAGFLVFTNPMTSKEAPEFETPILVSLNDVRASFTGTNTGLRLNLNNEHLNGIVYYGLFPNSDDKFPQAVYFKKSAKLEAGVATINISQMAGKYDIANWEENAYAKLGYRITDDKGQIIYDGKIYASGKGPFKPALSIVEGPFVNKLASTHATISFTTNFPSSPYVEVNGKKYEAVQMMANIKGDIKHEILINGLQPSTKYDYTVVFGDLKETYSFKTAPASGSREKFTFAYVSDSRQGNGGGERNIHGTNAYVMKRMAAMAMHENSVFMQFTGDMINGYSNTVVDHELQYANWKRCLESFWHYMPFYVGPGNHEVLLTSFNDGSKYGKLVDKFPFNTSSAEKIFSNNFVNPTNGPISEDGSKYDPNENKADFPPYGETVYYYTYDNVAMVVLNSNYLYTPEADIIPLIGGNVHGYIMDNQLDWLKKTLKVLEKDEDIDNVFVTIHTPAFPNAGHSHDDMWYSGNNEIRPIIGGVAVEKGMLERRDEFLNLIINKSPKVVALLCGDEHNYTRTEITNDMIRYPEGWDKKRLKIKRSFWQITNGSAGAPYYGQEKLPWSSSVKKYTTQFSLMLFDIDGKKVNMRVVNPDTFEMIEKVELR
jgi:hypothetical protein